jgi:type III restriction enzyme
MEVTVAKEDVENAIEKIARLKDVKYTKVLEKETLTSALPYSQTAPAVRFRLKRFQEVARDALANDAIEHIKAAERERISCLNSPTGSGKTIILSKAIKKIHNELDGNVAFIWLTIGKGGLAEQSKASLEKSLNNSGIGVFLLDEALISCPNNMEGNVVVVNWEILNKEDKEGKAINIAMKDGDITSFPDMCKNTRLHCPIVLIIDESHTHADTEKSKRIRNEIILPSYTIVASATPTNFYHFIWNISYNDVRASGLIKKDVVISECLTTSESVAAAAEKLIELTDIATQCNAQYLPKILVFIPNKSGKNTEIDDVLSLLETEYGWTEDNGKVKLWLSGAKNTDECKGNWSETKVIITKEAVDTGVDIPSIQVIVQLRPSTNAKVQIQRIGRGQRMPEQKHYGNELDTLYLFAFSGFDDCIDWTGAEYLRDNLARESEIRIRDCFRESFSKFPHIVSEYTEPKDRFVEFEPKDFSEDFYPIFRAKIEDHNDKFNENLSYEEVLKTYRINFDEKELKEIDRINRTVDEVDIGDIYDRVLRLKLKHISKHTRCIEKAILDGRKGLSKKDIKVFVLNNILLIIRLIGESITECQSLYEEVEVVKEEYCSPPEVCRFVSPTVASPLPNGSRSLYDMVYVDRKRTKSGIEKVFENMIHKNENVEFIARNYDRHKGSYSVVYIDSKGHKRSFFPDFLIHLFDGRWIMCDTKGGTIDAEKENKKDALVAALKGTDIIGGIVKEVKGNFYIDFGEGQISFDDLIANN